jgi:hypothetical protein
LFVCFFSPPSFLSGTQLITFAINKATKTKGMDRRTDSCVRSVVREIYTLCATQRAVHHLIITLAHSARLRILRARDSFRASGLLAAQLLQQPSFITCIFKGGENRRSLAHTFVIHIPLQKAEAGRKNFGSRH